jgi:predicted aminopeptidase
MLMPMPPVPFSLWSPALPFGPRTLLALACLVLLAGCQSLGYYAHVAGGHARLLGERRPIEQVLADPSTPAARREQLQAVVEARRFATQDLQLPANASYLRFVDLHRPFVTWAVFAAPEFSVQPLLHCFPIVGCVAYRGYFDESRAQALARELQSQGLQTWVGGVGAYSTLGWFDDPLLSTMLDGGVDAAVSTMFHELVHQKLFVRDDTAFNESLAVFVEREGMRQWRREQGWAEPDPGAQARSREFTLQVLALREALDRLYRSGLDEQRMRLAREQQVNAFRADYRRLRRTPGWRDDARYDRWVDSGINNASLLPFGLYDQWVDAFAQLFDDAGRDWGAFHTAAESLAALKPEERAAALSTLMARQSGRTSSNSTSNTSDAPGGIRLPAPLAP